MGPAGVYRRLVARLYGPGGEYIKYIIQRVDTTYVYRPEHRDTETVLQARLHNSLELDHVWYEQVISGTAIGEYRKIKKVSASWFS